MALSKINQAELKYSCSIGEAKVNLFTGRLLFNHPDISIGINSYQIGISHIYNSKPELPSDLNSHMGTGWKLNVQQYLFIENSKYVYMDGAGYKHEFELLSGNQYYDTTGMGLILTVNSGNYELTDEPGNKMIFESGRLIRTISCHNSTIIKYFNYNTNGQLISIYDGRSSQNQVVLNYDESTGLLKSIVCKKSSIVVEEIKYFYDSRKCLEKVIKIVDGIAKIDSLFRYSGVNLWYAVSFEDKSTLRFSYTDEKVNMVATGIANISVTNSGEDASLYSGDDIYCGDNIFLGEAEPIVTYGIQSGASTLGVDKISQNNFEYNLNNTVVTNEKNVKVFYFLNEKGFTTSVLEANNGSINDFRSLGKIPGLLMISSGLNGDIINKQNAHDWVISSSLSTANIMSSKLDAIKDYRINKYPNYVNYTCSFWLKINNSMSNPKIQVVVISKEDTLSVREESTVLFDNSAVNSWQFVSIPLHIKYKEIDHISFTFLENVYYPSKSINIADMRLCYSPSSRTCLTDGTNWISLDEVTSIKYTTPSQPSTYIPENITSDFYISEADLHATYLSRFNARGVSPTGNGFTLSCCNNTKKILVSSVSLLTNSAEFSLDFGTDEYGTGTRCQYFHELKSPDGEVYTYGFLHFNKNKLINGKYYDCIRKINEVDMYPKSEENHVESHTETCIDFKGKLLVEQDEYEVQNIFEYDSYGILSTKTIQHKDTNEKIINTASTSPVYNRKTDIISDTQTYYNNPFGNVERVRYNGNNESISNVLTNRYSYDNFNNNLLSIENDMGGGNFLSYANGKLFEVTPIGWNESNAYGFKIIHNELGDPNKYYLTYKSGSKKYESLLLERSVDRINNTSSKKQYRNTTPDFSITRFDKYGNEVSRTESGKTTTFKR